MHKRSVIGVCVVVVGGLLSASSVAAQDKGKIEHGMKVYAAQKCGVCHSIEGKGAKKGPLDGVGSKLSEEEIRQWIVNATEMTAKTKAARKPVMKNYKHLPPEDIEGLVAYMSSLKKS